MDCKSGDTARVLAYDTQPQGFCRYPGVAACQPVRGQEIVFAKEKMGVTDNQTYRNKIQPLPGNEGV